MIVDNRIGIFKIGDKGRPSMVPTAAELSMAKALDGSSSAHGRRDNPVMFLHHQLKMKMEKRFLAYLRMFPTFTLSMNIFGIFVGDQRPQPNFTLFKKTLPIFVGDQRPQPNFNLI